MATKTSQQPSYSPFSRLSRFGAGLGLKSQPPPTYPPASQDQDEEDWYIAYNGPYEVPVDTRKRDSWGDIVEEEGRDAIADADLIRRYGGSGKQRDSMDSAGYRRGRAQSTTSRVTTSPSPIDANRRSMRSPQRRSTNLRRGPVSSYINLDAAGGVGDSPMPPQRFPNPLGSTTQTSANRTGMANFFFGTSSGKKLLRSPSSTNLVQHPGQSRPNSLAPRKSTSLDEPRPRNQGPSLAIETNASRSAEDDYYNSYYSTLLTTPKPARSFERRDSRPNTANARLPTQSTEDHVSLPSARKPSAILHPYAYAFPAQRETTFTPPVLPRTAPPVISRPVTYYPTLQPKHDLKDSLSSTSHQTHGYHSSTQPLLGTKPSAGFHHVTDTLQPSSVPALKISISAPNLRRGPSPKPSHLPRGVDRWLSAESWCDAVILPRPRFKVKQAPGDVDVGSERRASDKGSGRIVSPPLTPIARSTELGHDTSTVEKQSFPERREQIANGSGSRPRRKLTKSKSAVSLRSTGMSINGPPSITVSPAGHHRAGSRSKGKLQKRRPRDLVLDDLAVAPSLERVLDEGDRLEEQRKQWQEQATRSFGNKATRSLSRGRSKSLNHKDSERHRKDPSYAMGSIDFLTARTLLGSQGVAPTIIVRPPGSQGSKTESGTGTTSSKSHSHSHSHSTSHGTQSSHGAHRRNDSWGQHALKLAKYTASGALCGIQDQPQSSPMDEKVAVIDGAIKATDTKVIQLRSPPGPQEEEEFVVIDKALFATDGANTTYMQGSAQDRALGGSPTPSEATGHGVGIALSTPPPSDGQTYDMPDHPYAKGTEYSYHHHIPTALELGHDVAVRGSEFAGPHPSSPKSPLGFNVDASDMSTRHRLPPQATLQGLPHLAHPYAMGSYPAELPTNPEDSVNSGKATDPEFGTNGERLVHAYTRISTGNPEPLGVGEALTSFRRQRSRDTGSGSSENQSVVQHESTTTAEPIEAIRPSPISRTWPLRIRRKPVSYADYNEDSSPVSQEAEGGSPSSEHLSAPRDASTSTVGNSSGSSPQHSPRPLGNVDDLDRFHDLFYRPDQPNPDVTASSASGMAARSGASHDAFSIDVGSTRSIRSGLSSLARKLTEEYEERFSQEVPSDVDSSSLTQDQRHGGRRGLRPSDIVADHEFIFSDPSRLRSSPPGPRDPTLPLQLDNEETSQDDNVPENVGSSRASSILEHGSMEDDTFGIPVRLGAVEAAGTGLAIVHDHEGSRHLSFVADRVESHEEVSNTEELQGDTQRITSEGTLAPPIVSADATRSSYMTNTTDGSRMSGLSDFPEPPPVAHLTPAHMSIIHSYFGGDTPQQHVVDPLSTNQASTAENRRHASNRMTFGGDADVESVGEVVPQSPDV